MAFDIKKVFGYGVLSQQQVGSLAQSQVNTMAGTALPTGPYSYPYATTRTDDYPQHTASVNISVAMVSNGFIVQAGVTKYIAKDMTELRDQFVVIVTEMQLDAASNK